jgi:hypothetical protein
MYTEVAAGAAVLLEDHIGLWDWRRRIAELYAEIRAFDDPEIAWRLWRETRNELFRTHPQSPLEERRRHGFDALALFDYDPAFRCVVDTWRRWRKRRRTRSRAAATAMSS